MKNVPKLRYLGKIATATLQRLRWKTMAIVQVSLAASENVYAKDHFVLQWKF